MKIWTNNEFSGYWPVPTAAVVIAENAEDAANYLSLFLNEKGLDNAKAKDMVELPFIEGQTRILSYGDY